MTDESPEELTAAETPDSKALRVRIASADHLTSSIRGFRMVSEHGGPLPRVHRRSPHRR